MMTDPLLSVSDLQVGFSTEKGLARVLDHVNFSIDEGAIVALVGESGCGKTTLARAILGVLPQNTAQIGSGSIFFDGQDLLSADERQLASDVRGRQITFIPQDPFSSFNPVFTIGRQIEELMKWNSPASRGGSSRQFYWPRRKRTDRQQVLELLKAVQLPDPQGILKKYPHEVSGGQRQRLMIAMALLPQPKLIIADEPTTALDVTIQAQILKLLRNLASDRGVSVLFTTHDLGTAYEICDRITVMYAGQEVENAPADDFFSSPAHPYTTRLLKSLPSRERGISGIPGSIPGMLSPPEGCRFHPRCDFASELCSASRPDTENLSTDHFIRCFHPLSDGQPIR